MADTELRRQIDNLFCLAKKGDSEAYGEIFDLLSDNIYRYVYLQTNKVMDAQDITSETFKRAWLRLKDIKEDNFRAYLYQIARNLIIDHFRYQQKNISLEKIQEIEDHKNQTDMMFDKKQDTLCLYEALKKIPDKYREVLVFRYIEGLSVRETAKSMRISQIAVRVMQYRAIHKLKKLLK